MGDEILMKRVILTYLAIGAVSLSALQIPEDNAKIALIKDYKMMFDRIGKKRIGAAESEIESVRPPFVRLTKEEQKKHVITKPDGTKVAVQPKYELQAILNNRAKISGKWYKLGEKVEEFTLSSINNNGVFLKNSEFKKRLTLRKKNEKISIK